jgi:hypothetical protein
VSPEPETHSYQQLPCQRTGRPHHLIDSDQTVNDNLLPNLDPRSQSEADRFCRRDLREVVLCVKAT